MAKSVKDKPTKDKPEWLRVIAAENLDDANRAFEARNQFIAIKIHAEAAVEDLNNKYGSEFQLGDFFSVQPEEEEIAIEMLGLDDSNDD